MLPCNPIRRASTQPGLVLAVSAVAVLLLSVVAKPVLAAEWYVLCELTTGQVTIAQSLDEEIHRMMEGPFPGKRTASIWLQESCPQKSCNSLGRCGGRESAYGASSSRGGWVAGEVTSVVIDSSQEGVVTPGTRVVPAPETRLAGPGEADLSPLIDTAMAAAKGCNFAAALASIEQIRNFDPGHSWYLANHSKLEDLSRRQKKTEQLVWQASSALSSEDLDGAREMAVAAAGTAVSCQSQAVSQLLAGIDTAIDQRRRARDASRRRAAAALLPGLIDLSRAVSGGKGSASVTTLTPSRTATSPAVSTPGLNSDSCAYKFVYRNKWNTEPVCTCAGYSFDARKFQCTRMR